MLNFMEMEYDHIVYNNYKLAGISDYDLFSPEI